MSKFKFEFLSSSPLAIVPSSLVGSSLFLLSPLLYYGYRESRDVESAALSPPPPSIPLYTAGRAPYQIQIHFIASDVAHTLPLLCVSPPPPPSRIQNGVRYPPTEECEKWVPRSQSLSWHSYPCVVSSAHGRRVQPLFLVRSSEKETGAGAQV